MPVIQCDKCAGTGKVVVGEPMSLSSLLEPFIEGNTVGFRLKSGAEIPRLASLEAQEMFGDVVEKLHGKE